MSAPTSSAPLVVNTRDGMCWTRRTVTSSGIALYAPEGVCACPESVMATLPELAELGISGSADVLPVPVGPEPQALVGPQMPPFPPAPQSFEEKLRADVARLQSLLAEATREIHNTRRERDLIRERVAEPYGCKHCGEARRSHGRRYVISAGMHSWERPSDEQVKDRMLARRAARLALDVTHDAGRRDRYAKALYEFVNGAFAWEACDDQGSWLAEADAAIVVADAEQAELRARVAELEAERHSTNEALDDAVQQLRVYRDRIAGLEARPLGWVDKLDAKSLDNFLTALGAVTEVEPMDVAVVRINDLIRSFREAALGLPVQSASAAPELVVYRAEYESMVFGLYATPEGAREHCEAYERRDQPTAELDWIEDEEDGVSELVATVDGEEKPTGYVVTALEVASVYDPEAGE